MRFVGIILMATGGIGAVLGFGQSAVEVTISGSTSLAGVSFGLLFGLLFVTGSVLFAGGVLRAELRRVREQIAASLTRTLSEARPTPPTASVPSQKANQAESAKHGAEPQVFRLGSPGPRAPDSRPTGCHPAPTAKSNAGAKTPKSKQAPAPVTGSKTTREEQYLAEPASA